ncbi:CLUMA_CG021659, isoform A [Clunio marinus]|uniref:CLUMA_CG021659, isoform A n=1 Tax=Clunio marinus TaxID=568069 RepID=A0A1J1J8N8_9DIPT|nr:CLUMA_CG021659, isoform A [Clunio marinus]
MILRCCLILLRTSCESYKSTSDVYTTQIINCRINTLSQYLTNVLGMRCHMRQTLKGRGLS